MATLVITGGGLGIIAAVLGIVLFLISVVLPLFADVRIDTPRMLAIDGSEGRPRLVLVDEFASLALTLGEDGTVAAIHLPTGQPIRVPALPGPNPTAIARLLAAPQIALGYADGSVRLGELGFRHTIMAPEDVSAADLPAPDAVVIAGGAVYSWVADGTVRRDEVVARLDAPTSLAEAPITALALAQSGPRERRETSLVAVDGAGRVHLLRGRAQLNLLTGQSQTVFQRERLADLPAGLDIKLVTVSGRGDRVMLLSREGRLLRYATPSGRAPTRIRDVQAVPNGVTPTAARMLNGDNALVIGRSDGGVDLWFAAGIEAEVEGDPTFQRIASFPPTGAAVTALAASVRSRTFAVADAAGTLRLLHSTSQRELARLSGTIPFAALSIAPRDDRLVGAAGAGELHVAELAMPHPAANWTSLLSPVWYESSPAPSLVWQSTGATDAYEPKLSLIPIIFGTVKGALYALVFSVPIAIGAAIFCAEFLPPGPRSVVKPVVELMASLPSVVIGFVVALVLSPIIEAHAGGLITAMIATPLALIFGGFIWQIVPVRLTAILDGWPRLSLMLGFVVLTFWGLASLAPVIEAAFFAGDFRAWTSGQGSGAGFTRLWLVPLLVALLHALWLRADGGATRLRMAALSQQQAGLIALGRWLIILITAIMGAEPVARLLDPVLDPRGGLIDTYAQRNAMIAAIAVGFANIPLIFTLAEDALRAVPDHLRAASLSCGATRWQTTRRVILPTAASGIFSAVMIGLGRAVGETMILVMATGNTPVLDWNLFNGLRALSANIAVELPEAARGGTLYRVLFLCALTLFAMTFVVNTLAEVVRQRFRRQAGAL